MKQIKQLLLLLPLFAVMSCSRGYEPIDYGRDACTDCKMTIVDHRFAVELVNKKGKVYKFDDLRCLKHFMAGGTTDQDGQFFVEVFLGNGNKTVDAEKAVYLQNEFFGSPMNGNYAAFRNAQEAKHLQDSLGIDLLNWEQIK